MVHGYGYHRISRIPVSEASSPSQTLAVVRTAELLAVSEGAVCSGPRGPRVVDHVIGLMEMIWNDHFLTEDLPENHVFPMKSHNIYIYWFPEFVLENYSPMPMRIVFWTSKTASHTLKAMKVLNPVSWFHRWWCYSATLYTNMKHRNARLAGYVWKQTIGANTHTHIKNSSILRTKWQQRPRFPHIYIYTVYYIYILYYIYNI